MSSQPPQQPGHHGDGQAQPQYASQPQYAPQPGAPQYAPAPQQYAPAPQHAGQSQQPAPRATQAGGFNALALVAFIITAGTALVWSGALPFITFALRRVATISFDRTAIFLMDWISLAALPLYAAAILLGILAISPKRPARGRPLAYAAAWGAGICAAATVINAVATYLSFYGRF